VQGQHGGLPGPRFGALSRSGQGRHTILAGFMNVTEDLFSSIEEKVKISASPRSVACSLTQT
jgi:hypothetical protein